MEQKPGFPILHPQYWKFFYFQYSRAIFFDLDTGNRPIMTADRYGVRKTILAQAKTVNPWITESAFLHSIRKKPLTNNKKEIMDAAESLLDITRRESSQFSQSSTRDEDANTPTRKFDKINSKKSLKLRSSMRWKKNMAFLKTPFQLKL